jgi:hypothetical protein
LCGRWAAGGAGGKLQPSTDAPIREVVIWFFERERSRLHYEIRRQSDGDDYELAITWPDGRQEIESYAECGRLVERSTHLQSHLAEEGWSAPATVVRSGASTRASTAGGRSSARPRGEG